jgi:hypothetical protein
LSIDPYLAGPLVLLGLIVVTPLIFLGHKLLSLFKSGRSQEPAQREQRSYAERTEITEPIAIAPEKQNINIRAAFSSSVNTFKSETGDTLFVGVDLDSFLSDTDSKDPVRDMRLAIQAAQGRIVSHREETANIAGHVAFFTRGKASQIPFDVRRAISLFGGAKTGVSSYLVEGYVDGDGSKVFVQAGVTASTVGKSVRMVRSGKGGDYGDNVDVISISANNPVQAALVLFSYSRFLSPTDFLDHLLSLLKIENINNISEDIERVLLTAMMA